MTQPLISILLPSRKRPAKLAKVIQSIRDTCNMAKVEIILRLDMEDETAEAVAKTYQDEFKIIFGFGALVDGKIDQQKLSALWDEGYAVASGRWICPGSDDIYFTTKGWLDELEKVPIEGFIVYPQWHRLNNSRYENDKRGCLPFFPKGLVPSIVYPPDIYVPEFAWARGWKPWFISGMEIFHEREADETLPQSSF